MVWSSTKFWISKKVREDEPQGPKDRHGPSTDMCTLSGGVCRECVTLELLRREAPQSIRVHNIGLTSTPARAPVRRCEHAKVGWNSQSERARPWSHSSDPSPLFLPPLFFSLPLPPRFLLPILLHSIVGVVLSTLFLASSPSFSTLFPILPYSVVGAVLSTLFLTSSYPSCSTLSLVQCFVSLLSKSSLLFNEHTWTNWLNVVNHVLS